jgi:UDP-2-acetamido-2-deoxy-ribo-hexuluronate aminotransferase
MQFIDLHKQQSFIKEQLMVNISNVLTHGKYINGPEVAKLEQTLAAFAGTRFALGCASGTDALLMALMAYGIKQGDAVFTTPFTFIATAEVIALVGATPVYVDIHADTFNMDAGKLIQSIEKIKKEGRYKPKGIIPVDLFGQPADYDEINAIASRYNLFVLEDAAQSFGALYKGRRAGSLAHAAATSFFPAKPLGCYGDGGMVFTDNEELYNSLVSIRVHGKGQDKYDNVRIGLNGRLDTMQAAVLLAKFTVFERELEKRQLVSKRYSQALESVCRVPNVKEHNESAWAQYSIVHEKRDRIAAHLKAENIPTAIYYPKPLHLQQAFGYLGLREGDFPVSERISERIISLPMHPYLEQREQEVIIDSVRQAIK